MVTDAPVGGTGTMDIDRPVVGWVGLGDQGLPLAAAIADTFELAGKFGADPVGLFEVFKLGSAGSTVLSLLNR